MSQHKRKLIELHLDRRKENKNPKISNKTRINRAENFRKEHKLGKKNDKSDKGDE